MVEQNHETKGSESEEAARRERRRRARKERVLHTRISEELSEDIRRMAEDLRVPVSNIVRNVLEEAFSVVEAVTGNVGSLIEEVVDEAEAAATRIRRQRRRRPRTSSFVDKEPQNVEAEVTGRGAGESEPTDDPEVLGWQPMVLARPQVCHDCGEPLERGANAYAGVTASGIGGAYVCKDCLGVRR